MIISPPLPDFSAETSCGIQDRIASIRVGAPILPRFGVLAGRDDRMGTAPCDGLALCNLVEQPWQHRRVAGCVIGHFDSPDFQCGRIEAKMGLAPLAAVLRAVLLCFPFAFAEHLDAGAVDQQVQARILERRPPKFPKTAT